MGNDIFRDDALAGPSILVTGGGGELGLEISKALAAKRAKVHLCGRRPKALEEATAIISHRAVEPFAYHVGDIRDADQIDTKLQRIGTRGTLHEPVVMAPIDLTKVAIGGLLDRVAIRP